MLVYRDVKTGRYCDPNRQYNDRARDGTSWWVVSMIHCEEGNFEVCLHNYTRYSGGGGCRSPVWPILQVDTEKEARIWLGKVCKFARTLPPENQHDFYDKECNGDLRLAKWLKENGWKKKDHIVWVRNLCPMCKSGMVGIFCTNKACPLGGRSPYLKPGNMSIEEAHAVLGTVRKNEGETT